MRASTSADGRAHQPSPRRAFFASRSGYLVLAAVVAALLIVGGGARAITPDAARIAHLESIIRCPSCADLSIADSQTASAEGLRAEVSQLVHQKVSDAAIEARIEAQFPGTLLIPGGDSGVVVFVVPAVVIVAGAITFAVLVLRRTRAGVVEDSADEELVEAARRARAQGR